VPRTLIVLRTNKREKVRAIIQGVRTKEKKQ